METILTRLQQSFAAWNSSSKRHSNASLREQAVNCLSHYSLREVSKAIGISSNSLRSWKKSILCNQGTLDPSPEFVAISLDSAQDSNTTKHDPLILQINLASGILIKVESTNIASSVDLIVALNKGSQSCSI